MAEPWTRYKVDQVIRLDLYAWLGLAILGIKRVCGQDMRNMGQFRGLVQSSSGSILCETNHFYMENVITIPSQAN